MWAQLLEAGAAARPDTDYMPPRRQSSIAFSTESPGLSRITAMTTARSSGCSCASFFRSWAESEAPMGCAWVLGLLPVTIAISCGVASEALVPPWVPRATAAWVQGKYIIIDDHIKV